MDLIFFPEYVYKITKPKNLPIVRPCYFLNKKWQTITTVVLYFTKSLMSIQLVENKHLGFDASDST